MSRGNSKNNKHDLEPDAKYGSTLISKMINYVMLDGKKSVAEKIVHQAIEDAAKELSVEPIELIDMVMKNVGPLVEVKGRRIGGANYQVPVEVNKERKVVLALRWILTAARAKKGKPMSKKLSEEFVLAFRGEGAAIKKRDDTHRMAEANKAFAHFARF